jgi:hypothetical protein
MYRFLGSRPAPRREKEQNHPELLELAPLMYELQKFAPIPPFGKNSILWLLTLGRRKAAVTTQNNLATEDFQQDI